MQDRSRLPCGNYGGAILERDLEVRIPSKPGEKQEVSKMPERSIDISDAFAAGYRDGWNVAREKAAKIALERTGCKNNCCMRLACVVARNIAGKISRMVRV